MNNVHYYESHVTIDPLQAEDALRFETICSANDFRVASLLKQNGEPSNLDAFCSGRSDTYSELLSRMSQLVNQLKEQSFTVRRYKIEAVLFDSKHGDKL